jgi:hypothetical protein
MPPKYVTEKSLEEKANQSYMNLRQAGLMQKIVSAEGEITLPPLASPRLIQNRVMDIATYVQDRKIKIGKGNGKKKLPLESLVDDVEIVSNNKVRISGQALQCCKDYNQSVNA